MIQKTALFACADSIIKIVEKLATCQHCGKLLCAAIA